MALTEAALEELLESKDLENVPAKLPGTGLGGPRPIVPVAEQRQRRETLAQMLSQGVSRDKIFEVMGTVTRPDGTPGFNMTQDAVQNLVQEVYQTWSEEDAEDRPHKKASAIRRIKRSLIQAKQKNAYTAVAQLERTLMMIEGTAEPIEVNVNGLDRVSGALIQVLNIQTPEQLADLVEEQKAFLKTHGKQPVLPTHHIIDVEGEDADELEGRHGGK